MQKKKHPYLGFRIFILFLAILSVFIVYLSDNEEENKEKHYGNVNVVVYTFSVTDSDTFRANIKDYPPIVGSFIPVQLEGIDTPRIFGKCRKEQELGQRAKRFLEDALRSAKHIELKDMRRSDDCFCIIARVYADDKDLSGELIRVNLGIPRGKYEAKKNWCL